jgi:hypothetical protein
MSYLRDQAMIDAFKEEIGYFDTDMLIFADETGAYACVGLGSPRVVVGGWLQERTTIK